MVAFGLWFRKIIVWEWFENHWNELDVSMFEESMGEWSDFESIIWNMASDHEKGNVENKIL